MNSSLYYIEQFKFLQFLIVERKVRHAFQIIGLIGNIFMFFVYSQKNLRKLSISTYLRCVAVFCTSQNIVLLLPLFINSYKFFETSLLLCKLINYFWILFGPLSAWFETIASLDRFITILFPIKSRLIQKPIFQRIVTITLIAYNILFYLNVLTNYELLPIPENNSSTCWIKNQEVLVNMDFVNSAVIPFILMTLFSIATTAGVIKSHKRVRLSRKNESTANRTRMRDIKFGITMIILNILFLILNIPSKLIFIIDFNPFDEVKNHFAKNVFYQIFVELNELYFAFVFFVQLSVNNLVRKELFNIFRRFFNYFKKN